MKKYLFWNNKGGTGKTSLCFQALVGYAMDNPKSRVLAVDLCPQANLSELLLGGLEGNGGQNLSVLWSKTPRCSIGGYFELRFSNPYTMPAGVSLTNYTTIPHQYNGNIPPNVTLISGDRIVELQANFMSSLAMAQSPTIDTYMAVVTWLEDLLKQFENDFDILFIDANPSFAIYTQIAIAASDELIVPVMADDSSRRALQNVLSLVYNINLPSPSYQSYTFNQKMTNNNHALPKIHMIVKNRITQYTGSAAAYRAVLAVIEREISAIQAHYPQHFDNINMIKDVRDFQSTGTTAFAEGMSFKTLLGDKRIRQIDGQNVQMDKQNIENCINSMQTIINDL